MTQSYLLKIWGLEFPDEAKTVNSEGRFLGMLFAINIAATVAHYVDNVLHLHEYPDLPTTQASSIVLFFFVMMPFGLTGYWLYTRKGHQLSYYLFYVYCLLNVVVIGHYTPSRLRDNFWDYSLKIHILIWLEVVTATALLTYVIKLHRSGIRVSPQTFGRVVIERVRHEFRLRIAPIGAGNSCRPPIAIGKTREVPDGRTLLERRLYESVLRQNIS